MSDLRRYTPIVFEGTLAEIGADAVASSEHVRAAIDEARRAILGAIRSRIDEMIDIDFEGNTPVIAVAACGQCGQVDRGQTGVFPCVVCGLPTIHDEESP